MSAARRSRCADIANAGLGGTVGIPLCIREVGYVEEVPEPETENARIVAAVREIFDRATLRLTPEIEPATIYVIARQPAGEEPAA